MEDFFFFHMEELEALCHSCRNLEEEQKRQAGVAYWIEGGIIRKGASSSSERNSGR